MELREATRVASLCADIDEITVKLPILVLLESGHFMAPSVFDSLVRDLPRFWWGVRKH